MTRNDPAGRSLATSLQLGLCPKPCQRAARPLESSAARGRRCTRLSLRVRSVSFCWKRSKLTYPHTKFREGGLGGNRFLKRFPPAGQGQSPCGSYGGRAPIATKLQGFDQPGHYASRSVTPRSKCDLYSFTPAIPGIVRKFKSAIQNTPVRNPENQKPAQSRSTRTKSPI